jgi:hypothetical protein
MTTLIWSEIVNIGKQAPDYEIRVSESPKTLRADVVVRDVFVAKFLALYLLTKGLEFSVFHQAGHFYISLESDEQAEDLELFLMTLSPSERPSVADTLLSQDGNRLSGESGIRVKVKGTDDNQKNAAFVALMWQWFLTEAADDMGDADKPE